MLEELQVGEQIKSAISPLPFGQIRKLKILVVDDDLEFRLLLSELLVLQGHTVITAKDGEAALERIRSDVERPDLIFLDLTMPKMDGWKFCEERLLDPRTEGIPLVMISGSEIPRQMARINKVDACLTKPFDVFQVLDVVGKILPET